VFDCERLEHGLLDRSTLLGLAEERLSWLFENCGQVALLTFASCLRRSNRSMRLPSEAARSTPVYAGWQFEQTSTTSSLRDERVVKVVPHEVQRTFVSVSSG
jgi:hypothetical protein